MSIIKKVLDIKKELEELKEENKQESWYNDMHENSMGHTDATPCDVNGGLSSMEYTIAKTIAQK